MCPPMIHCIAPIVSCTSATIRVQRSSAVRGRSLVDREHRPCMTLAWCLRLYCGFTGTSSLRSDPHAPSPPRWACGPPKWGISSGRSRANAASLPPSALALCLLSLPRRRRRLAQRAFPSTSGGTRLAAERAGHPAREDTGRPPHLGPRWF
jgi:hypothetical protein